jgi:hypothetical protein
MASGTHAKAQWWRAALRFSHAGGFEPTTFPDGQDLADEMLIHSKGDQAPIGTGGRANVLFAQDIILHNNPTSAVRHL